MSKYFYNRPNLNLTTIVLGDGTTVPSPSITYDHVSFYEVDMIPFFMYTTASNVDMAIKTPYAAVAPHIDYGSGAFSFIGTVDIVIDSSGIVSSGAGSVGGGSSPGTTTTTWTTYLYAPTF